MDYKTIGSKIYGPVLTDGVIFKKWKVSVNALYMYVADFIMGVKMDLRLKFDEDVINYDKMRPTYVKELYHDVIHFSNFNSTKTALEVGIGTGQATLPFLQTGCALEAIELGEHMAEFVKKRGNISFILESPIQR